MDPATTPPTCKWVDSLTVSPAVLATSGLHRMRTRVVMDQPSDVVRAGLVCMSMSSQSSMCGGSAARSSRERHTS